MITLRQFTEDNAHRFWAEGKHLEDCKQQIYAFCSFGDHDNRWISEFKASDVFRFTDKQLVAGLKVSTINRYKCALKKIFREAVDMEECTKAPIIKLSKATKGRVRFYTKEEISEIKDWLMARKPWIWLYCTISLNTGMRSGEITKISESTITPCGNYIHLAVTKNGDGRDVYMNQEAKTAVLELLKLNGNKFVHSTFYRIWDEMRGDFFSRGIIKDQKDYNSFVFHVFRHTCATNLSSNLHVPIPTISEVLGHRSVATTMKYAHAKPDHVRDVMMSLGNYNSNAA
jgi:integrase